MSPMRWTPTTPGVSGLASSALDQATCTRRPETMPHPIPRGPPMPRIDASRPFIPVRIAVLTVSDTRALADDRSGDALVRLLTDAGHQLAARDLMKDEVPATKAAVERWIVDPAIDVVLTTGGTGFTGRDVTPEALEPLFEKRMEGFATMFLLVSERKIGTS